MPVVLTKPYLESTFFIPMKADKSEGVWVKPLTLTSRKRIQNDAIQEAGQDQRLADEYVMRDTLKACVIDWIGFFDVKGIAIPYEQDVMLELIKYEPEIFSGLSIRIMSVARFGELEEIKN